jgi:hypothetical protein
VVAGPIVLDAQSHLVDWYVQLGYVVDGDEFVEDGIPHVPMRRARRASVHRGSMRNTGKPVATGAISSSVLVRVDVTEEALGLHRPLLEVGPDDGRLVGVVDLGRRELLVPPTELQAALAGGAQVADPLRLPARGDEVAAPRRTSAG